MCIFCSTYNNEIELQKKSANEFKDILTLEQMQRIEEWCDILIDNIVYDSNTENWDVIGNEGSKFHDCVNEKENLIFLIETEDGDKFGLYMKEKIRVGKPIYDENAFVFTMKDGIKKYDFMSGNVTLFRQSEKEKMVL